MAKTIQSGALTNNKSFQDFSYFLGGIDTTDQNLDKFTPFIRGVARLFLHKPPHYMNVLYPEKTKNFKTFLEAGSTRVDGINDIDVEFVDFEGGFAGQRFSNVSLAKDTTEEITITMHELSGSPLREYVETWVTGVRDPRSGIAHYHGAIESGLVTYGEINHTSELIYTNMDPTARHIEYSAMFAHAFPTRVEKSHFNYDTGNRDKVEFELPLKIEKYESPAINDIGSWYLAASKVEYNYLEFKPAITQADVKDRALSYGNSSGN